MAEYLKLDYNLLCQVGFKILGYHNQRKTAIFLIFPKYLVIIRYSWLISGLFWDKLR